MSCVSAAAIFAASGQALAQDNNDEEELEEIVVSGFRSALEKSAETKRKARGIVEAVTAEDIGKLPDVSIAETLARLPGLATQRVNGRAQLLSIRGLSGDFSTTLLNGREQVSTSDNRSIEFDQYPAEMIEQVVVYKTPQAGLIGQAIAGTVDLRTVRPLQRGETVVSANALFEMNGRESQNPDLNNTGFRGSVTYIDQFADDTIGVAIGAAFQQTPTQNERFNAWGYQPVTENIRAEDDPIVQRGGSRTQFGGDDPDGAGVFGIKPFGQSAEFERVGLVGVLEFNPSANFSTSVEGYYSDFTEEVRQRGIEFPFAFLGNPFLDGTSNPPVIEDGLLTQGTFVDAFGVVRNDVELRERELFAIGWNGLWNATDNLEIEGDFSYSRAERDDRQIESYSGTGFNRSGIPDQVSFNTRPSGVQGFNSLLDYTDRNTLVLTDPHGWGGSRVQAGFENRPMTLDELWQANVEARYRFDEGMFSQFEVGANYGQRTKERDLGRFVLTLAGGAQELPIPDNAIVGVADGLSFLGFGEMIAYDPLILLEDGVLDPVALSGAEFAFPQNWTVQEDVLQLWARLDIDTELDNGMTLTGDVGVQLVYTDQSSTGFRLVNDEFIPVVDGDDYWEILPSLNLSLGVTEDIFLRFSATKTLVRARMDALNASVGLGLNPGLLLLDPMGDLTQSAFSGDSGNPTLRPILAENLDLSLEYYFSDAGYVAISTFYKDLDGVIGNDNQVFDAANLINPELDLPLGVGIGDIVETRGLINRPGNIGEGEIYGMELTLSLPFADIFAADSLLSGFGFVGSFAYVGNSLTTTNTNTGEVIEAEIPGISEFVINNTLYYEYDGFEARISNRYRTGFIAELPAISAQRAFRESDSESVWDAQIGYAFQEGPLEGVRVYLQGINIFDEEELTTITDPLGVQRIIDRNTFGATFLAGFSFTY